VNIELYGDRHNSEEYATNIQEGLASNVPEAIMFESPDLKGEKASYLLKSLKLYPTLAHVYKAFDIDVTKREKVEDRYKAPMYEVSVKKLEEALEALFSHNNISESVESIVNSEEVAITREKDMAITSLFRTLMFKKIQQKNTLIPRIALIIRKSDADIYTIDAPQEKVYGAAAKNISNAPSTVSEVKLLMKRARRGETSGRETAVANEILNKTSSAREKYMAKQITQIMQSNNYSLGAAIMGRSHLDPVYSRLNENGIKSNIQIQ